ncbi:hypothetical protein B0T26DRAFT_753747 [Lasiosphaeria miniovina]|uniref:Uncharacterized protein n=1 Tax=Lasiosphaeria miniovina TaxID=1954250 RepID=A0AA40AD70_9PEZI|nr:uncharacterized protein B0T26DRAFT_753747 [Lasiosphaeria miniovina]KAK0713657.1 hypothetical protein B0T26DRAFT_753747 [Lasiosphaeria miniovina]
MSALYPQPSTTGIPHPAPGFYTEVRMHMQYQMYPVEPRRPDHSLYTTAMTDCTVVATFNTVTRQRTMCHVAGGNMSDGFVHTLATQFIDANTIVIIASGTSPSHSGFVDEFRNAVQRIAEGMHRVGRGSVLSRADNSSGRPRPTPGARFWMYHTSRLPHSVDGSSFILRPDGVFGREGSGPVLLCATTLSGSQSLPI